MDETTMPPGAGIRALADLCVRAGVDSLEAAHLGWSVRLQLDLRAVRSSGSAAPAAAHDELSGPIIQLSQWVGVFHRAAEQGGEPLAREGRHVREGDLLGVIIAMQLQSDVRAEHDGILARFLVEDGGAVEYGQPLLELA